MSKKLFISVDKKRHFLLYENTPVLEGDFVIKGTDGEKLNVDVKSINKFEISKEEANAWLKDQLKTVMGQLKTGLKETLFNSSPKKDDANESDPNKADSAKENKSTTPGLDLLADITDTPREGMDSDYSAIGQALKTYLKDITSVVTDGVSGDSDLQQSASERLKVWKQVLSKHGIEVADIKDNNQDE